MNRRNLLKMLAAALPAATLLSIVGCQSPSAPEDKEEGLLGSISDNHLHRAKLVKNPEFIGDVYILDITGTSNHPHTIQLTREEIVSVLEGKTLMKQSSYDWGHNHQVVFNPPGQ